MINKVTLVGNMGKDPEVKHFESGAIVAQFSLATNENYKDKEGNWQDQTEWHNIVVWRELAERAEKYFKKALSLGMTMDHNIALAKLSLAGIAMAKRNKREATMYLQEAKKADKNKLLADQIKMMKDQMGQLDRSVQQTRNYR